MSYGELKIDTITFTAGGVDTSVSVSGLVQNPTFTGNITTTGTISGDVIKGNTVSGTTVTGDAGEFSTITGNTAGFTTVTGTTVTGTTANFVTVSGTTVTGNTGQFTNITGVNIVGTTQVSGATITGDVGLFSTITGGIHTLTSGVFASGTAANPSITFVGDLDSGIYSSAANEVAISTSGTGRLFVDGSGRLGLGTSNPQGTLNVQGSTAAPSLTYDTANLVNLDAGTIQLAIGVNSSAPFGAYLQGRASNDAARVISLNPAGGNVGIGTASPNASLEIIDTAGGDLFTVQGAGSDVFKINSSSDAINLDTRNTSGGLNFQIQGSDKARIDSSGRLLVGTSSARGNFFNGINSSLFQVEGTGQTSAVRNLNDVFGSMLLLGKSRSTGNTIVQNGDTVGLLTFQGNDGSDFVECASIRGLIDGTPGADDMPGRLLFLTTADGANSSTERMRIDSSGNVGIGTTAPDSLLEVRDSSASGIISRSTSTQGTNTNKALKVRNNSDTDTFSVSYRGQGYFADSLGISTASPSYQLQLSTDSAGKPSTNTWTIVSDERIKEDIELADLDICYDAIKNIPLKRFKWKDEVYTEEQVPDRHKLGWIAQDVESVFPKAVNTHEFKYGAEGSETVIEDCRDLNADQLYAAMYGTIQKLITKVETLEAEVAALKGA